MARFLPVLVQSKADLDRLPPSVGQYIVVLDSGEIYVDKENASGVGARVKVTQNVFVQATDPRENTSLVDNPEVRIGDVWCVTEEDATV